tara:strand:- start:61 stop:1092 length:1032 start_codon:yes stop_codon:yes gene_type:complete
MSFNKPSMNGLNNFDVNEFEKLVTINSNKLTNISYENQITKIDNQIEIANSTEPQMLMTRESAGDTSLIIRGQRNNNRTVRVASIDLENNDINSTSSTPFGKLVSIAGRVTNTVGNFGGLEIVNYVDGITASTALVMSYLGNFSIGNGLVFQDLYKLLVSGGITKVDTFYHKPTKQTFNFDKSIVSNSYWGLGHKQTTLSSSRLSGVSFCSHSNGSINFSSAGTYKIKVNGNLHNINLNARVGFALYLVTLDSNDNIITEYFENEDYNFFSWCEVRNNGASSCGNVYFEDIIYISTLDTEIKSIEIRNKISRNSDNIFDDSTAETNLNVYLNVSITKITDENF